MKKIVLLFFVSSCMLSNAQKLNDMLQLDKYAQANLQVLAPQPNENRVVFIGNSITEGWVKADSTFFASNNYIGRGISGQTSPQLVLRFRQDVIDLKPKIVVINIGTNDIAGNTGLYNQGLF